MKIKILSTVEIPLEPLFIKDNFYNVVSDLGKLLVSRGYAEEVKEKIVEKEHIKSKK